MDDGDLQPARRYPPLQRTPPDYQTVIKFLVMASILDSVWVSGPRQTGSSCGLTGATTAPLRPLDLSPPCPPSPEPANVNNASRLEVQEALLQLNTTARDCLRRPGELSGASPTLRRVLSVLLSNAFVVWSNFGAALVASPQPRWLPGVPGGGGDPGTATSWRLPGPDDLDGLPAEKGATSPGPSSPRPWTAEASSAVQDEARVDAARTTDSVPWYVQLAYFATLVVVVVGMPCCPAVLQNACGFLMC
ncbi:uncharacterized protein LOC117652478 [Thrips palmi]|uniref:Uncharacterized protein LOC117652478 n=1 Tax=Thrips palmi TaxID=161013 RepID=A0A6P9A5U3_THRPL|nr:uncharacterized protein LOC117652478 [Thrips palmi]